MTDSERLDAERRRRMIVDLLAEDVGHGHSVWVLRAALGCLDEDLEDDAVSAHVNWLASAGLVEIVREYEPLAARVTEKGMRVAAGSLCVPGVAERIDCGLPG